MKSLSPCHNKPIARSKTNGFYYCTMCGFRCSPKKTRRAWSEANPVPRNDYAKPADDFFAEAPKPKAPDTRDMIRHLSHPMKFAACMRRGFRTTDVSRVNCMLCMRTQFYRDALAQRNARLTSGQ